MVPPHACLLLLALTCLGSFAVANGNQQRISHLNSAVNSERYERDSLAQLFEAEDSETKLLLQNKVADNMKSFRRRRSAVSTGTSLRWHQLFRHRVKRQWNIPPISIPENDANHFLKYPVSITSDQNQYIDVRYKLTGGGADKEPVGLFTVNQATGVLGLTRAVDREEYSVFTLQGHAFSVQGQRVEEPCNLTIAVIDQNDNFPIFTVSSLAGSVLEHCQIGTTVMKVIAIDADDPNTMNGQVHYEIVGGSDIFSLDKLTGTVTVMKAVLDREVTEEYSLTVKVSDSQGMPFALTTLAKSVITIVDINDNAPHFTTREIYASVVENSLKIDVTKLIITDRDKAYTKNWWAVYSINSGDLDKHFQIVTNRTTNEGVLSLVKPLDYEEMSRYELLITVQNEVPLVNAMPVTERCKVIVTVVDQAEPPVFTPIKTVVVRKYGLAKDSSVTTVVARDPDNPQNSNIRYSIHRDAANVLTINSVTGEVTSKAQLSADSPYIYNNTYTATVIAVKDGALPLTGTGTVVVIVDGGDQGRLSLVSSSYCVEDASQQPQLTLVARDDGSPSGRPLTFTLPGTYDNSRYKWTLSSIGDTSSSMSSGKGVLECGTQEIPVVVTDKAGLSKTSVALVKVCDCKAGAGEAGVHTAVAGGTLGEGAGDRAIASVPGYAHGGSGIGLSAGALAAIICSLLLLPLLAVGLFCMASKLFPKKEKPLIVGNGTKGFVVNYMGEAGEQDQDMSAFKAAASSFEKASRAERIEVSPAANQDEQEDAALLKMRAQNVSAPASANVIIRKITTTHGTTTKETSNHSSSSTQQQQQRQNGVSGGGVTHGGLGDATLVPSIAAGTLSRERAPNSATAAATNSSMTAAVSGGSRGTLPRPMSPHARPLGPGATVGFGAARFAGGAAQQWQRAAVAREDAPPAGDSSRRYGAFSSVAGYRSGQESIDKRLYKVKLLVDADPAMMPLDTRLIYSYEGRCTPPDSFSCFTDLNLQ